MGLVKLYRVTGDLRYLNLARFMIDVRGPDGTKGAGRKYNQSQAKVVDQDEAVGHAVRAMYLYSGVSDVAALTRDEGYVRAMDRIWDDVVDERSTSRAASAPPARERPSGWPTSCPTCPADNDLANA